jgi:hypothetical protein
LIKNFFLEQVLFSELPSYMHGADFYPEIADAYQA